MSTGYGKVCMISLLPTFLVTNLIPEVHSRSSIQLANCSWCRLVVYHGFIAVEIRPFIDRLPSKDM